MLYPYGLGGLLSSTETPTGKMMPWLRSERCMLPWTADKSTWLEPWGGCQQPPPNFCMPWCPQGPSPTVHGWDLSPGVPELSGCRPSSPQPLLGATCGQWASGAQQICQQANQMAFSNTFSTYSAEKLTIRLGLKLKTLAYSNEPLKRNTRSRI